MVKLIVNQIKSFRNDQQHCKTWKERPHMWKPCRHKTNIGRWHCRMPPPISMAIKTIRKCKFKIDKTLTFPKIIHCVLNINKNNVIAMELEPKTTWFKQNIKPFSQPFEPMSESHCSHWKFRYWACFYKGGSWHLENYRVKIYSKSEYDMIKTQQSSIISVNLGHCGLMIECWFMNYVIVCSYPLTGD